MAQPVGVVVPAAAVTAVQDLEAKLEAEAVKAEAAGVEIKAADRVDSAVVAVAGVAGVAAAHSPATHARYCHLIPGVEVRGGSP